MHYSSILVVLYLKMKGFESSPHFRPATIANMGNYFCDVKKPPKTKWLASIFLLVEKTLKKTYTSHHYEPFYAMLRVTNPSTQIPQNLCSG